MAKMIKIGRKELKQRHLGWLIVIVLGVCLGLTFPVVAAIWGEEPQPTNHAPECPAKPSGPPPPCYTWISYTYSTSATDQDGDWVRYRFNWGDGTPISGWTRLVPPGESADEYHTWMSAGTYEVTAQAMDEHGATSLNWSIPLIVVISSYRPATPSGPSSGYIGVPYTYSTSATDPSGNQVKYGWDWNGDSVVDEWSGFGPSGWIDSRPHSWSSPSIYYVKVKAQNINGVESGWSFNKEVLISNPTNDDSNDTEVGVEWVSDYEDSGSSDLYWAPEIAEGFYYSLGGHGWTQRFDYGHGPDMYGDPNYTASERHFEKSEVGGSDSSYVDAVDFAWYCGHGYKNELYFGFNDDGDNIEGTRLGVYWDEAEWGDGDLEWIVLHTCDVLYDDPASGWDVFDHWGWPVFRGLHAILGFKTATYGGTSGYDFVNYMTDERDPYPITEAWYLETKAHQDSSVWAAYLAEWHCESDYLPGHGTVGPDVNPPITLVYMYWQC